METALETGLELGDAPSIYFTLTENISEICVCFELNQQVADTSNVCTVEIVKEAP